MKIAFDNVAGGYSYPVGSKEVKALFQEHVPESIRERVTKVRFGCNQNTTQEARIVARGATYDIRINFALKEGKSRRLASSGYWLKVVESFGGVVNKDESTVSWSELSARRYAVFLLFHEIGHVIYAQKHGETTLVGKKSSPSEEKWCDSYARGVVKRIL